MSKRLTTEEFVQQCKAVHGDKYDYSLVEYRGNKKKVIVVCKKHGSFKQIAVVHKSGGNCPYCINDSRKDNKEEFIKKATSVHGDKYDYSLVDYKNSTTKVTIICPTHGEFEQKPNSHLAGKRGCAYCSKRKNYTTKEFVSLAKKVHGDKYDYSLAKYKNGRQLVTIICPIHGKFEQKAYAHLQGHGCYRCPKTHVLTTEEFIKRANHVFDGLYIYPRLKYINAITPVTVTCKEHGDFQTSPTNHIRNQAGCPKCKVPRKLDNNRFIKRATNVYGDRYDYSLVEYLGAHVHTKICCPKHGVFLSTPDNHYLGNGCKRCSPMNNGTSKAEYSIVDFIKSFYKGEVLTSDRTLIPPKEIDIFIPDRKLAIEFDGIYWHSTRSNKDKRYHLNKTEDCLKEGIQLIHVYEDEWEDKQSIVKSLIRHKMGYSDKNKVYARNCVIDFVSNEDAKEFLNKHHIQGYVGSSIKLGLYINDELVSYMGFKRHYEFKFDLNRYATACQVVGGFSKLLAHFKRNYDWKEIITYADRRYSTGDLYRKTGFALEHISPPSFDYVEGSVRINRQQYMKHKLKGKLNKFDPNLTEAQNMELNGYYQIWNCGYLKFVLKKLHK